MRHIAALRTHDRGLGYEGKLLYYIPADLKWFKSHTKDQVVVMGRKTWDSLPKKPLPERVNVVLSKTATELPGAHVFRSWVQAKTWLKHHYPLKPVIVMGGQSLYEETLDEAETLWLTEIRTADAAPADTFYPDLTSQWVLIESTPWVPFPQGSYRFTEWYKTT